MSSQTPLEHVFLDAGGVLVYPNWIRISEALARHGIHVEADVLARAELHAKHDMDTSATIASTDDQSRGWIYFDRVLTRAGITLSAATDAALGDLRAYHESHNLWEYMPPDVMPTLDRLVALGLTLTLVSNSNGTVRAHFARMGLASRFKVMLDSFEEGVEKPDPKFFEIALARVNARPEATIHVGDFYHIDVLGARAAAIRPILLDVAGLYADCDCERVQSLHELVELIESAIGI